MKTTRPVFESFSAFVNNLYEMESQYPGFFDSLNEADATSYASPLLDLLKGSMKLDLAGKDEVNALVTGTFNKIFTDSTGGSPLMDDTNGKDEIAFIIATLREGIEALSNSSGLKTVAGSVVSSVVEPGFEYLKSGTVRGKDLPVLDGTTEGNNTDGPTDPSLAMFLAVINGHNLLALYNNITSAKRGKAYLNAGSEANLNQFAKMAADQGYKENTFLEIDTESLSTQMIVLQPYTSTYANGKVKKDDPIKYGWQFPLYGIPDIGDQPAIVKGGGDIIDASYYDKVIEPGGNEVKVENKQYSAPPEATFFPENGVEISASGKQALNAILSEFNSISTITVHGGASSKPTSRTGGNEQLAKDRMKAGIVQLTALQKAGVKQLKDTKFLEGTASVQTSNPDIKSDPTKQQVSFTISGMIRQINVTPEPAVVIPTMETLRADKVTFTKYIFQLNVNAEPTAKNMAKRSD
jgi:hypothetical protein